MTLPITSKPGQNLLQGKKSRNPPLEMKILTS